MSNRSNNRNTGVQDEPLNQEYSTGTNAIQVAFNSSNVTGWAGQDINIVLEAMDELGHPAGTITQFTLKSSIFTVNLIVRSYYR